MVLGFRRKAEFETRANVMRCVQLAIATHTPNLLARSRNCITNGFFNHFQLPAVGRRPSDQFLFFNSGRFFSTSLGRTLADWNGCNASHAPDRPQLHRVHWDRDPLEDLQFQPQQRES